MSAPIKTPLTSTAAMAIAMTLCPVDDDPACSVCQSVARTLMAVDAASREQEKAVEREWIRLAMKQPGTAMPVENGSHLVACTDPVLPGYASLRAHLDRLEAAITAAAQHEAELLAALQASDTALAEAKETLALIHHRLPHEGLSGIVPTWTELLGRIEDAQADNAKLLPNAGDDAVCVHCGKRECSGCCVEGGR